MNDDLMLEYLLQAGAMRPEEEQLARRQAQVNTLRQMSLEAPQAQQAGRVVVAPSWTQALASVAQGYAAKKGQQSLDQSMGEFNNRQAAAIKALRDQMAMRRRGAAATPAAPAYAARTVKGPYDPEDDMGF